MVLNQVVLTDFLNHGILPFVGRTDVMERVHEFRRGAIEASGLRTLLILGEAGVGKSRLIEEIVPTLEKEGGAVVHCRLRPASGGSLISLLADVLWNSPTVRPLLRGKPSGGLDSVVDALRRLCRLRPALIVVEDIHLLTGETLRDFAVLLNVLADDPISLLCASRPVDDGTLALLESSLVERVELSGLRYDDIASLGNALFGPDGAQETISTIAEETLGNPLAIRGALRGALRQEAILRETTGGWRGDERFRDVVKLGARSITEGLAAHLTPEERRAADALASLGEIFSYEAAEILLGQESEKTIESLLFKGILVRSATAATPLPKSGRTRYRLLAFTHTLVHHTLLEEGKVPAMKLLEVLERQVPLYSIVPYERLAGVADQVPKEDRFRLIDIVNNGMPVAWSLDETSGWTLARQLLNAIDRISRSTIFSPEERVRLELGILDAHLKLLERDMQGEEFKENLDRLFALALALPEDEAPPYLIGALAHQYKRLLYAGHEAEPCDRLEREVDALVMTAPSVVCTEGYVRYLGWKTERASLRGNWEVQAEVERHIEELIKNVDLPKDLRRALEGALCTNYLLLVRTPEEYAKRLARIKEGDESHKGLLTNVSWLLQKARFYGFTGHLKRQWDVYTRTIHLSEKQGQRDVTASLATSLIKCRAAMGLSPDEAEEMLLHIRAIAPTDSQEEVEDKIGTLIAVNNLAAIVLMNGQGLWAVRFYDRYFDPEQENPTTLPILLALYREDPAQGIEAYKDHPWIAESSAGMARLLRGEGSDDDRERVGQFLRENLAVVPIATRHILHIQTALRLYVLISGKSSAFKNLADSLRAGVVASLEWASERELWPMLNAYLREYGHLLEQTEAAEWRVRAAAIEEENKILLHPLRVSEGRARLSMFGAVRLVSSPEEETASPRGQRLKTLLGVMVANEILSRPLERDEFLLIASGNADDPKHARDIVNKTVSRLREGLGNPDIILTDGETPRLNREVVEIDILEAMESLARTRDALRRRALVKGVQEIRKVLDLWKGEVPYPTLYDEFFESLREEFELAVRDAVLLLAQGLLEEQDNGGAQDLLRRLYAITPEDEEVEELLVQALEAGGRKVEAMRVRQLSES